MSQAETFSDVLREGETLETDGKWLEAADRYAQALKQAPLEADIWYRVGRCLHRGGEAEAALQYLEKAEMLAPEQSEITLEFGDALQKLRRLHEAVQAYKRVLNAEPGNVSALTNLGVALQEGNHPDEAFGTLGAAYNQAPDDPVVLANYGTALLRKGQLEDAYAKFARAAELAPNYAAAWSNLAVALQDKHEYEASLSAHRRALHLANDHPEIHWNYGVTLLLLGDYLTGFKEWEYRRTSRGLRPRDFGGPEWCGEDLRDKIILIHAEQGVGDTLQFARFIEPLAARGAQAVLAVQRSLATIFESIAGVDQVVTDADDSPPYDLHVPLLSLPYQLGVDLETLPARVPYVLTPANRPATLPPKRKKLRIGLVWAGNPRHANDHNRSCPFENLLPLFCMKNIEWIGLQTGERAKDPATHDAPVLDLSKDLTDFAVTSAVITELDLVISVDTAVSHLTGAMGRPVWILLPHAPDWRWLVGRNDSPWYPTARLFRQKAAGDWSSAIVKIRESLDTFMK